MDDGVRDGPREIFQRGESHSGENVLELPIFFDKPSSVSCLGPFSGDHP